MSETSRREKILNAAKDLAGAILHYDRKDDEDLPRGEIEAAIIAEEITAQEIVDAFASALRKGLAR